MVLRMPKVILVVLLGLFAASCAGQTPMRSCNEMKSEGLQGLLKFSIAPEEMRAKIASLYNLELEKVNSHSHGFSWEKDGLIGTLRMEGSMPTSVGLNFRMRQPLAKEVISCFGAPAYYRAWFNYAPGGLQHTFEFDLYFPQKGLRVSVQQDVIGSQSPQLDGNTSMVYFFFVPITPTETTMERLSVGLTPNLQQQIKPWPGSWKDIIIDIEPSAR